MVTSIENLCLLRPKASGGRKGPAHIPTCERGFNHGHGLLRRENMGHLLAGGDHASRPCGAARRDPPPRRAAGTRRNRTERSYGGSGRPYYLVSVPDRRTMARAWVA